MASYYLDASAIVKRYLREAGSRWIIGLWESTEHSLSSVELVDVEVVSALSRAYREGRIGLNRRNQAAALFTVEAKQSLDRVPVSTAILESAYRLALRHPVRAYDAIHLAIAQELVASDLRSGLPAPIFVSADVTLLAAAQAEGLQIDNPNHHP
jgi:predicted nucleic acid-binding protein